MPLQLGQKGKEQALPRAGVLSWTCQSVSGRLREMASPLWASVSPFGQKAREALPMHGQ